MAGLLEHVATDGHVQRALGGGLTEIETSLTRAGRPFLPQAELALAPALRQAAMRLPGRLGSQTITVPECPLPAGVPDLLVLIAKVEDLALRSQASVAPLLAEQEALIAAACGVQRATSLARLAWLTGTSDAYVRRIVVSLERRGALQRTEAGWVRAAALVPMGRTYALEAKVSDWRSGISQCLRYGTFADASGLAIGTLSARSRTAAIVAARENGIGLFHEDKWLVRPRISHHRLARRLWVSEHLAAALALA